MHTIKNAGPELALKLAGLWVETFRQAYEDVHTPDNIQAYCDANFTHTQALGALEDKKTDCSLAYKDGVPVGFFLIKHHSCPVPLEGTSSELKQIYILSSQYGSGLGSSLLEEAFSVINAATSKWAWLAVSDINFRAQAFYQKNAFSTLGQGPTFDVGTDRLTSTIMAYELS